MSDQAHFRVVARLDGPPSDVEITIDRDREVFHVKRVGKPGTKTLPLATVAEMVYSRVVKEDLRLQGKGR